MRVSSEEAESEYWAVVTGKERPSARIIPGSILCTSHNARLELVGNLASTGTYFHHRDSGNRRVFPLGIILVNLRGGPSQQCRYGHSYLSLAESCFVLCLQPLVLA